ncbi:MAG: 2-C-methyl-D-erythritol 2,4-cyclodiphosphate synthase [Oscillospiraceae bacterium]
MRIGQGYDVHRLVENRTLILGGVKIPCEKGLLGHSDADVLTHAIMDALLGALALGDIGQHFPDDSADYQDADSLVLLQKVVELVRKRGFSLINVDSTIVAQAPKLKPYMTAMREKLAEFLQIPMECVSVKATTEEGLGITGQGEGMTATAICLLESVD